MSLSLVNWGSCPATLCQAMNLTGDAAWPHVVRRTEVSVRERTVVRRLEVRLDDERRRRLEQLAVARGIPISEVVRRLIDDAYEEAMRKRRHDAVARQVRLEVEDPPDPATLSRELEEAHEPGGLH